eukprot:4323338-Amphidinium_carterae.1
MACRRCMLPRLLDGSRLVHLRVWVVPYFIWDGCLRVDIVLWCCTAALSPLTWLFGGVFGSWT